MPAVRGEGRDAASSPETPRFAVDRMLGRLARWLRVLGYDALYAPNLTGEHLVRRARVEGRLVLTRDRRLAKRANVPLLFVHADHFRDQLRQVVEELRLDPGAHLFSRCVECNVEVEPESRERVRAEVPVYVYETQHNFCRCPRCRRVYWPATHREHVLAELRTLGFGGAREEES